MSDHSQAITFQPAPQSTRQAVKITSLATLFLPNFCTAVFAVTLLQVLFLFQGANGLFRDTDTGWHIRNGEWILDTMTVPRTDRFSYTRSNEQWFAWEWLSDIVLGSAHRFAGLSGVALLTALTIASTAWAAARLSLALGGNFFFTAAGIVLLLGTTSIHWLARPHIFSWFIALVFLSIAERERRTPSRAIYLLPLITCLWTNIHGSFLLGPAMLFIYAIGNRRFATAGLLSCFATLINPYGWHLHQHVLTYLRNDYLMDHIAEFRSFSFHVSGAMYVELFLLTGILGAIAFARQRAFGPALLILGMLHLSLYSARHIATAAVLVLPLCIAALSSEAESWPKLRRLLEYSGRLREIDLKIRGAVPIIVVLVLSVAGLSLLQETRSLGFDSAAFPVSAAEFLGQKHSESRVFAKDQWGGYLVYRFAGRMKVFIDGRSDFYEKDFLETYARVMEVKPGWDAVLRQHEVQYVLVEPDVALASALTLSSDWKRVYSDAAATVFERVNPS